MAIAASSGRMSVIGRAPQRLTNSLSMMRLASALLRSLLAWRSRKSAATAAKLFSWRDQFDHLGDLGAQCGGNAGCHLRVVSGVREEQADRAEGSGRQA